MIIYDALGVPHPEADICSSGFYWPKPREGYYYIAAAATLPKELDGAKFSSQEEAIKAAEKVGYIANGTNKLLHVESKVELDKIVSSQRVKWQDATPCYVRFGLPPKGGRSRNHQDETLEEGVSVFYGEMLPNGEARALPQRQEQFVSMISIQSRPMYIVTGTEIGLGADGEPVLADCTVVREAKQQI